MTFNTPQAAGCTVNTRQDSPGTSQVPDETGNAETAGVAATRMAVIVLGMHRSGTSATTRVISLLGADLPSNLMPGMADNETGFWESLDTYVLNEGILAALGSRWDDWRRLSPDWMGASVPDLKARALDILERNFAGSGLFVLKDPRICRLLPFWLESLHQFGAETRCILPFRNPIEVAASLRKRDGFSPAKSYMLWLRHVLDAERATRNLPRAFLAYDDLLDDWRGTVSRVAERLGLSWPLHSTAVESEIDRFLKARLRHHITDETSLQHHPGIAGWIKDTFTLLQALLNDPGSREAQQGLDEICDEFDRASDALGAVLRADEKALDEARQTLVKRDAEAGVAKVQISEQGARIRELEQLVAAQKGSVEVLEKTVARQDARISELSQVIAREKFRVRELVTRTEELEETATRRDEDIRGLEGLAGRQDRRVEALEQTILELKTATAKLEQGESAYRDRNAILELQRNRLLHRLNAIQTERTWRPGRLFVLSSQRQTRQLSYGTHALPPRVCSGSTLKMKDRRRLRRQARRLLDAGLFDVNWYVESNPDVVLDGENPVWHWLVTGWRDGLNPNPFFDTGWYQMKNPDVFAAKTNPLLHYLDYGAAEGRDPGPLFDSDWYQAKNADVGKAGINPLVHYLKYGRAEGRDPNPLFDSAWYVKQYPHITEAGVDAIEHYLMRGAAEGCKPSPLFDTDWYLKQNADVARDGVNPLVHYLSRGAVERRLTPCPLFDSDAYLLQNPHVAEAGMNPLVHYVTHGATRGCDPNPLFDSDWYLRQYPDVAAAGINPLAHYLLQGADEGRDPGPRFETARYVAMLGGTIPSGLNPLHHYLQYGRDKGCSVQEQDKPDS